MVQAALREKLIAYDSIGTPRENDNYKMDIPVRMSIGPYALDSNQVGTPQSMASSKGSLVEVANEAISGKKADMGHGLMPRKQESVRDNIRLIHAHSKRDLPQDCLLEAIAVIRRTEYDIRIERDFISWSYKGKVKGQMSTEDVVAAEATGYKNTLRIHYFVKGKGKGDKVLRRIHKKKEFRMLSHNITVAWVDAVRELVRWQARVPKFDVHGNVVRRKIKVVVNPHSGKRKAPKIWVNELKPLLDLVDMDYCLEETSYSGHATDMGKEYESRLGFESLVFVSGDGTICEYLNGLLARPEEEWREVVTTTPISLISAGTQNAFGVGVGIPSVVAAVYAIVKRKMRPLDVITTSYAGSDAIQYSCCGLGWGVAGDIAEESERYRWMGTSRYSFLKLKRGVFKPKMHTGTIRYIATDPQPELKIFSDVRNTFVEDQHIMELGSPYDANSRNNRKSRTWSGMSGAVRNPAAVSRYPEPMWTTIEGRFVGVGALNTVPDGKYTHPSDGNMDLLVARRGSLWQSLKLLFLYGVGKELSSPLMHYVKVKAVIIDQNEKANVMNMDGEVLPGPGPWKMEVVPSLFKVLSEK